ncbi:MAG TPA: aminotransferase class IV [Gillisia sp.]|nr:aminotransferase class IV [Gillisia sp.]
MNSEKDHSLIKKTYPVEVYFNGKWMLPGEAFVSVFDRGFMFGDGVYEVTPFYKGDSFRITDHLDRLKYSLKEIGITYEVDPLHEIMNEALSRQGLEKEDAAVYIQITRGAAPRTHYLPVNIQPTLLLYAFPVLMEGFENKEAEVLVSEDLRWHRCDIKSISLLANIQANDASHIRKLGENLLVRGGFFTEGSHTSIFFVKNDRIFTHPEGHHILSGITRKVIIELCEALKFEVIEKAVHIDELVEVDEIFLTGTTTQVLAVKTLFSGEKEIFTAGAHKITRKIQQAFIDITRNRT